MIKISLEPVLNFVTSSTIINPGNLVITAKLKYQH